MSASKLKKIKIGLRYGGGFAFWRIINSIITGTLISGMVFSVFFTYQNLNTALANTTVVKIIKPNITFDALNINGHEKAEKIIEEKKSLEPIPKNLRNIFTFSYNPSTTTPTYEQTTTTQE
ncbi:MAG: hypothetical protein ABIH87_00550 [bacterium]